MPARSLRRREMDRTPVPLIHLACYPPRQVCYMHMNFLRIALASLGGAVAYFAYGFAMFAAWPSMRTEFKKYPNVYRAE
jgi:hypothetical protein